MSNKLFNRKGQNMAEYAIIFGVIIAAAVGIAGLIKEGIQDRVTSEVRKIGDDQSTGIAAFDIASTVSRTRTGASSTNVAGGGAVTEADSATISTTSSEVYNAGN